MKKKLISMLLAASMTVSLCACGGEGNQDSQASGGSSSGQSSAGSSEQGGGASTETAEAYVPTYPIVEEPITVTGLVVDADLSFSESRIVWDLVEEVTGRPLTSFSSIGGGHGHQH